MLNAFLSHENGGATSAPLYSLKNERLAKKPQSAALFLGNLGPSVSSTAAQGWAATMVKSVPTTFR
jgi:hypothetical protein